MSDTLATPVLEFLHALWRGDRDGAKQPFAADATWWFLPSLPYPRPMAARDAVDAVLDDMIAAFDPAIGLKVEMHSMMTDGVSEVAADYSARSVTRSGKEYENRYVLRASVRDGLIEEVRPFTDPNHLSHLFSEVH